jgi:hypothetical protein
MPYLVGDALLGACERRSGLRSAGAALGFALAMSVTLGGCATGEDWPSMANISDISNGMTPEQRQKALQELQKDDTNPSGTMPRAKSPK